MNWFSDYLCPIMRSLLTYILLFAVLLPSVSPWGIIAHYQLNKEYIARVLCENRNRPELHCDGKCYLARRLQAQQDKQDKETTERVHNMPLMQLFCESGFYFNFSGPTRFFTLQRFVYLVSHYDSPICVLLRPPRRHA
ncbi:hypothetical protein [Spirosoma flavum]|uniref:Uncharacterized protein n=1 Tax=Spirosoma flavum TaxID=2048557 RepID=A0ABW6AFP6_9BACT